MVQFILNKQDITSHKEAGMTVLDFVRYHKKLYGTKIGCREGDCGACTVLVGRLIKGKVVYQNMTSCLMPLANAHRKHIVTIEGLNMNVLNPAQQALVEEGGTQCGFCTVGFIVSMTGYSMEQTQATNEKAIAAIDGNICRCTGYKSIERACQRLVNSLDKKQEKKPIDWLVDQKLLPAYFTGIPKRIKKIREKQTKIKSTSIAVGGGTDLYVQRPEDMVNQSANHLFNKEELKNIFTKDGFIHLGAEMTATDILDSPIMKRCFPKLDEYMRLVSSTPIRNMGTIAGNFVNASPIGDLTIFFLALNSDIILSLNGKERIMSLKEFYTGYKKLNKKPSEIIHWVRFKKPSRQQVFNFEKVSKRTNLDIASVNSALLISQKNRKTKEVHVSVGGVGPIPIYLFKTSQFLTNKTLTVKLIKEAHQIMDSEISPISDARGTDDYKRLLARQLFFAHFIELFPSLFSLKKLVA